VIGHRQLDKLRAEHVQAMINRLQASDLQRTAQYARTILVRAQPSSQVAANILQCCCFD
jgi:hypothetical protein